MPVYNPYGRALDYRLQWQAEQRRRQLLDRARLAAQDGRASTLTDRGTWESMPQGGATTAPQALAYQRMFAEEQGRLPTPEELQMGLDEISGNVIRRDLGGPTGAPPATNRYQVAMSPKPWQTEIYRGGELSEVNQGTAWGKPLVPQPSQAASQFEEILNGDPPSSFQSTPGLDAQIDATVRALEEKSRRFDAKAQDRWRKFSADQAYLEAWVQKYNPTQEEVLDLKNQLFQQQIMGYDWDSHVQPMGSIVGDMVPDEDAGGFFMKERTGDPKAPWNRFVAPNPKKNPQELQDWVSKYMMWSVQQGGHAGQTALFNPARRQIGLSTAPTADAAKEETPSAKWAQDKNLQAAEGNFVSGFNERYGREPVEIEIKQGLAARYGQPGQPNPLPTDYSTITPYIVSKSLEQWGTFAKTALKEPMLTQFKDMPPELFAQVYMNAEEIWRKQAPDLPRTPMVLRQAAEAMRAGKLQASPTPSPAAGQMQQPMPQQQQPVQPGMAPGQPPAQPQQQEFGVFGPGQSNELRPTPTPLEKPADEMPPAVATAKAVLEDLFAKFGQDIPPSEMQAAMAARDIYLRWKKAQQK